MKYAIIDTEITSDMKVVAVYEAKNLIEAIRQHAIDRGHASITEASGMMVEDFLGDLTTGEFAVVNFKKKEVDEIPPEMLRDFRDELAIPLENYTEARRDLEREFEVTELAIDKHLTKLNHKVTELNDALGEIGEQRELFALKLASFLREKGISLTGDHPLARQFQEWNREVETLDHYETSDFDLESPSDKLSFYENPMDAYPSVKK